ncbi:glycosyltransferase family 4 protein [Saccharicrinis sp. FJH2]|uniref:glycosyltransferase family 4 protein n=1 Tax=Saccharicrinis sp. FJH65 TaxID=3344659 RepID=UPI0035F492A4
MNILITAPNLDPNKNVSGVSSVVNLIINSNSLHHYSHYLLGRPDKKLTKLSWLYYTIKQILLFPFAIKKNNIDLIHQNLPFNLNGVLREVFITFWSSLMKKPIFLHVHGGSFLMDGTKNILINKICTYILKKSSLIVVLSEVEKNSIENNFNVKNVKILVNCVDTNIFKLKGKKSFNTKPNILFLGRTHESKGIQDIVEAFKLLKQNTDFSFSLCGKGPLLEYFKTECDKILGEDFKYYGVVSGEDKISILEDSDYFILPSRYGEGLPIALLESMSMGLVPIVTDDASMKYIIQNEVNGIIIQKSNPQDLYEKLKKILLNIPLSKSISANAAETIRGSYNVKNYILSLNSLYSSIIS